MEEYSPRSGSPRSSPCLFRHGMTSAISALEDMQASPIRCISAFLDCGETHATKPSETSATDTGAFMTPNAE